VVAAPAPRPRRSARTALRSRRAPFVLLVVALLAGTTLGLLVLNTAIAVDSLEATRLRADNAQRAQDVQRLEQQVIDGNTPAAIAQAAVEAGLVPAGPAAYLVVGEDGTVTLRGEAVPAEAPEPAEVPAIPAPPAAGGGDD
jgi:type II secretory pathway pseudopilin PulG